MENGWKCRIDIVHGGCQDETFGMVGSFGC